MFEELIVTRLFKMYLTEILSKLLVWLCTKVPIHLSLIIVITTFRYINVIEVNKSLIFKVII